MCTNKYSNKERYDKVIAKTKWCSFFMPHSVVTRRLSLCDSRTIKLLLLGKAGRGKGGEGRGGSGGKGNPHFLLTTLTTASTALLCYFLTKDKLQLIFKIITVRDDYSIWHD